MKKIAFVITLLISISIIFTPRGVFASDSDQPRGCTLSCIGDSFQQIFPFDIFAGIPPGFEPECPKFTIFNRDFEFCLFLDAVKVLKYPVIIALLIKVYLFS